MNDHLIPVAPQLPALTAVNPTAVTITAAMTAAGQAANDAAAQRLFADYRSRRADNTLKTQAAALASFAHFLAAAGLPVDGAALRDDPAAWQGVTWGMVEAFTKWLLTQGYSVATVNNRLTAVKVYAKLAAKAGAIPADAYQLIKAVGGYGRQEAKRLNERRPVARIGDKKADHVPLSPDQARRLKAAGGDNDQGRRDRLLFCLLLDHGLRVGEVAQLTAADFNLKQGELRFYRPKVDKRQIHKLTADTMRAARAYFDIYPASQALNGRLLLGSRKNGLLTAAAMSERAICKRVNWLGQQIGVDGLSPHDCRHFWATDAARNGTDPFRLQEAGGWSSLAMPRRYVEAARIANEGVKLSL